MKLGWGAQLKNLTAPAARFRSEYRLYPWRRGRDGELILKAEVDWPEAALIRAHARRMSRFIENNSRQITHFAAAPGEARVAHDLEQPGLPISTFVAVKESKGAQVGFLDHVLCIMLIPRQPPRQVISRIQVRKDDLFKKPEPGLGVDFGVVHSAGV